MDRKKILSRAIGMSLTFGLLAVPFATSMPDVVCSAAEAAAVQESAPIKAAAVQKTDVVLVGSLQDELGAAKEWDPADTKTIMKSDGAGHHVLTGHLPKGNYDFKVVVGGSWDVNYGANGEANDKNIALRLLKDHDVTFTYDDATHAVTYDYAGKDAEEKALAAEGRSIVLTGTVQSKAGAAKDWDPSDTTTRMKAIGHDFYSYKMKLPAGTYYYKISVNGSWAENYGLGGNFDGANVQLTLPKVQEVTFYYNDKSHHIADSTSYTFRADKDLPVLSGSFGAVDDPLMRDQMLDNLFQKTIPLQKGDYTVTVKMPGEDALTQQVNVAKDGDVTFYYDSKAKRLIADDGRIREDKVYHDSWSTNYRVPFEAVKEGTPVKLSLATGKGDVTSAKLVVYKAKITANGGDEYNPDYTAGTVTSYPMTKASTSGDQDIWTASFTPTSYGLYGYKFVLNDTKEYGDDAKPGSTGGSRCAASSRTSSRSTARTTRRRTGRRTPSATRSSQIASSTATRAMTTRVRMRAASSRCSTANGATCRLTTARRRLPTATSGSATTFSAAISLASRRSSTTSRASA